MRRRQSNASKTGGKGAKRMKEFGYKAVTCWFDQTELQAVDKAAKKAGLKRASYVRKSALDGTGVKFTLR